MCSGHGKSQCHQQGEGSGVSYLRSHLLFILPFLTIHNFKNWVYFGFFLYQQTLALADKGFLTMFCMGRLMWPVWNVCETTHFSLDHSSVVFLLFPLSASVFKVTIFQKCGIILVGEILWKLLK